jgi:DNA-binding SARP family transcriptional activator
VVPPGVIPTYLTASGLDAGEMEFRLLGPVELRAGGRAVDIGGPRQRSLVAALAVDAGRPVPVETLIDRVWGQAPPARARHALQVYVSRLRGLLRQVADGAAPVTVVQGAGGYLLDVDPDRVDLHRFRRMVEHARSRDCPDPVRVVVLESALALWRGPPLGNVPVEWAARARPAWEQRYLEAVQSWAHASLRIGDPAVDIARLTDLVVEHPLAESLAAMYMRALCAAGRPAAAVDHFARFRRLLADELGIDPGHELQQLHQAILRGEPIPPVPADSPAAPEPPGAAQSPAARAVGALPVHPAQLPPDSPAFTGRRGELAQLLAFALGPAAAGGPPTAGSPRPATSSSSSAPAPRPGCGPGPGARHPCPAVAIVGMPGVGKTALAVHAAHRLARRFPDGQLVLELRGYTTHAPPVTPADALARALRALGVPAELIPHGVEERAGRYRSRLAGRRVLILLDDAACESQVQPLLPGTPGCLALVTSRRRLSGLDHAAIVALDPLSRPDAVAMLARLLGGDRMANEPPELVAETVELCGRLPLAIRMAAARLVSHPSWGVRYLVERLRATPYRLSELAAGQRGVAAALDGSYRRLTADQRRCYRSLGRHPGPDVDAPAAAALLGVPLVQARRLLDQLLDEHLLQEPTPGRYEFRPLTRAHAAALREGVVAGPT